MSTKNKNFTYEDRQTLAQRIYDLDYEVYTILGTGIGRVFNGQKERTIRELTTHLGTPSHLHFIRSEIALIGNMARTIPDKSERTRVMSHYNDIMKQIAEIPNFYGSNDILDEDIARLNHINLSGRFGESNHLIICIGRTYGCAGTDIGFALADKLHINYYDTEIFTEVLERLEAEKDAFKDRSSFAHHQNPNRSLGIEHRSFAEHLREFNRYHGLPKGDAIFFNQSDLLCDMAKKEDFIVMGRCADVILTNNRIPHISIFIDAPFEARARRVMTTDDLTYKGACKLLKKLDKQHRRYHEFYTGLKWGAAKNYDLCINSAAYGIDGSVELIERLIKQHTKRIKEN